MYSKTCLKRPLKKKTKTILMTKYRLMQVKSIAECSKGSILHYFRPSLSYHLSLRSFFFYFSGRLRQVLLYFLVGLLLYKQSDLLLLPLWVSVIVLCFVVRYFMSILVLQSS